MSDADRDPGFVVREVIDPVGDSLPDLRVRKVVRVDRDRRSSAALIRRHSTIEVRELRITIRMVFPFPRLAIRLQAVASLLEQLSYRRVADDETLLGQFVRQVR